MLPVFVNIVWLNLILVAFLLGFGFAAGWALFGGIVGLFKRGE